MDTPKRSTISGVVMLLTGLFLVGWDLWDRLRLRDLDESEFGFYIGLFFIALGVAELANASRAALNGATGAFLLVFLGTVLRDVMEGVGRQSSDVWILVVVALVLALAGLFWLRKVRPWPAPRGDA
jgi:hypothetical protein